MRCLAQASTRGTHRLTGASTCWHPPAARSSSPAAVHKQPRAMQQQGAVLPAAVHHLRYCSTSPWATWQCRCPRPSAEMRRGWVPPCRKRQRQPSMRREVHLTPSAAAWLSPWAAVLLMTAPRWWHARRAGLALVLQRSAGSSALGLPGSGLGYAGLPGGAVAVEVDLWADSDARDPGDSHVAVLTRAQATLRCAALHACFASHIPSLPSVPHSHLTLPVHAKV
jgi:hypothetical protein